MVFNKFKIIVEKKVGVSVKAFCSDRGGESASQEFTTFCEENVYVDSYRYEYGTLHAHKNESA